MIKKLFFTAIFAVLLATQVTAFAAAAQPATIPCTPDSALPCIQKQTQESGQATRTFILDTFGGQFLKGFIGIVAASSVIFIIVGGLQMHVALGNEEAITKAKKTLMWAVGGLVIAILAAAIVQIVSTLPLQ